MFRCSRNFPSDQETPSEKEAFLDVQKHVRHGMEEAGGYGFQPEGRGSSSYGTDGGAAGVENGDRVVKECANTTPQTLPPHLELPHISSSRYHITAFHQALPTSSTSFLPTSTRKWSGRGSVLVPDIKFLRVSYWTVRGKPCKYASLCARREHAHLSE